MPGQTTGGVPEDARDGLGTTLWDLRAEYKSSTASTDPAHGHRQSLMDSLLPWFQLVTVNPVPRLLTTSKRCNSRSTSQINTRSKTARIRNIKTRNQTNTAPFEPLKITLSSLKPTNSIVQKLHASATWHLVPIFTKSSKCRMGSPI
jgi:hypothetical protein